MFSTLLHRPADLRLGAVDRHHAGRRRSRSVTLPVAQYPEITPPTVEVSAVYPGANAQVVADTVAAPIEQQVNGVEDMLYMSSQCTNDGTYTLTVTFKLGIDLNMAQVLVQNRVALAAADPARPGQAPRRHGQEEVAQHADDRQPVLARRQPRQPLPEQLRHDPAPRRAGAARRRRRHHLPRPARLQHAGLARPGEDGVPQPDGRRRRPRPSSSRTSRSPPGRSASRRSPTGQAFQYTMSTLGRLADAEQFGDIIVKTDADGRLVRLRDVARDRARRARATTRPARSTASRRSPCRSTSCPARTRCETAERCADKMEELKGRFPDGRRLRDRLRHDAVHRRVDQRGVQDAARRGHPGRHRRAASSCRTGGRRSSR